MKKKNVKHKKLLNKKEYGKLLDQLCPEECLNKECFFKDVLATIHPSPRLLVQLKCINRFKKQLAKENGVTECKIDSTSTVYEWIERGYAEKFAESYDENKTFIQIYKETIAD